MAIEKLDEPQYPKKIPENSLEELAKNIEDYRKKYQVIVN